MVERVKQAELARRIAEHMDSDPKIAAEWLEAMTETIYECFRAQECVTLQGLGNFYIREERGHWVFKFNPSQRLRALLRWSSTYRGPL